VGAATEHPCPRAATVVREGEDEPRYCPEHAAASKISDEEEEEWIEAEFFLEKCLRKARKRRGGSVLIRILEGALEEVKRGQHDVNQRIEAAHAVASYYRDDNAA
jgi:hypothetical protein